MLAILHPHIDKIVILASSVKEAISLAEKLGAKTLVISGGASNNSAFMYAGMVKEVIFDVEPILIGSGIPVFSDSDFKAKLKLITILKISKSLIQLRYKVL